jgi:hypothetical protein
MKLDSIITHLFYNANLSKHAKTLGLYNFGTYLSLIFTFCTIFHLFLLHQTDIIVIYLYFTQ